MIAPWHPCSSKQIATDTWPPHVLSHFTAESQPKRYRDIIARCARCTRSLHMCSAELANAGQEESTQRTWCCSVYRCLLATTTLQDNSRLHTETSFMFTSSLDKRHTCNLCIRAQLQMFVVTLSQVNALRVPSYTTKQLSYVPAECVRQTQQQMLTYRQRHTTQYRTLCRYAKALPELRRLTWTTQIYLS